MSAKQVFSIPAIAGTDIWRKPPSTNAFNAPTSCLGSKPLKQFQRARVTFSLPPRSELNKYDQGGLLLSVKRKDEPKEESQWIKTGIEYYLDEPWIGTVCCDRWADWSITPLGEEDVDGRGPKVTIEAERSNDELGKSLWIYVVKTDKESGEEKRIPLREVNWIFANEEETEREAWVDVSAFAARPLVKEGRPDEELLVKFWDFKVDWRE